MTLAASTQIVEDTSSVPSKADAPSDLNASGVSNVCETSIQDVGSSMFGGTYAPTAAADMVATNRCNLIVVSLRRSEV